MPPQEPQQPQYQAPQPEYAPPPSIPTQNQRPQPHSADQGRSHLTAFGKRFFKLIEFDEEEELLLEIRKHPFGLFVVLITSVILALAVMIASFALASSSMLSEVGAEDFAKYIALAGFVFAVLIVGMGLVYAYLYRSNVIFITDDKIAQVRYITLFNRKISQLSLGDVQDVTVNQVGLFPRIFKYGTLVIETAGEQNNYTFTYVPDPYESSKVVIGAHERNLHKYGN